jgi:hypothetical protein
MDLVYILPSESDVQVLWNLGRWTVQKHIYSNHIIASATVYLRQLHYTQGKEKTGDHETDNMTHYKTLENKKY